MPIPRIIHQAWVSNDRLKERYFAWRYSWIKHNPDFSFMFWDLDSIPWDKLSVNGEKLMRMPLKYTVKSDIIRWELLLLYGGVWADMDMECQKPFPDEFFQNESFAGVSYPNDGIGNALVGFMAGDDLVKQMRDGTNDAILSDIPRSFDNKRLNAAHGAEYVGSNFLYKVKKIYPRNFFYPYHPLEAWRVRKNPENYTFPDSYCIHHWEGTAEDGWGHVDY